MWKIAVSSCNHSSVADLQISDHVSNAEDVCGRDFGLNENPCPLLGLFPAKHSLKNGDQEMSILDS